MPYPSNWFHILMSFVNSFKVFLKVNRKRQRCKHLKMLKKKYQDSNYSYPVVGTFAEVTESLKGRCLSSVIIYGKPIGEIGNWSGH